MNRTNIYKALRYVMSFIFLWAFADKTFGLGYATVSGKAWINGVSPTSGFLLHATGGPLAEFFQSLANHNAVDWLFMLGLLGVGLGLLFHKYIKWASVAGIVMMLLMYLATFPPENNPLVDDHIVYILVLAVIALESRHS